MRSWLISSLVLAGGMVLPAAGWAQQPARPVPPAHAAPAPATEGGNMDEPVRIDPSQLVCGDGRSLCEVTATQTQDIQALRSEVVALRAQVTTVAARSQQSRARTPTGRAPSRAPQPPPVLVRVRRLEATTDATALRLEQLAQNLTVPAQSEICRLLRANPALATPPGVDCGTVDERLRAVIQAASRAVAPTPVH